MSGRRREIVLLPAGVLFDKLLLTGMSKSCLQLTNSSSSRSRFAVPSGMGRSTSSWVLFHTGTAWASRRRPLTVSLRMRLRRSAGSGDTSTSPRRSSGFSAAVSVVRSIASNDATGAMDGGAGRLSDMSRENWPLVSSNGRSASSKRLANARAARCTWRQRQVSLTSSVVSNGSTFGLDTTSD